MSSNQVSPKKLLHSKWTAVQPKNKEKHFAVVALIEDEEGVLKDCVLEAVLTKRTIEVPWRELKDAAVWQQGWKG